MLRIVGIGASAGGLEAISELLGAVSTETDRAYIVVQHLDRTHGSLLSEILAKRVAIPVTPAVDGETVRPDHVYVIPPNATLTVVDGHLHLTERPAGVDRHLPVDALFQSLAIACGENAVAVVLSGGDSDGSLGIQAIKREGGVVFAQTPDTAQVPSMPRSAIATGCVDMVLRPREIARELGRMDRQFARERETTEAGSTSAGDTTPESDEASLSHILSQVRAKHGIDFTHYKRSMLRRRISRRMMLRGMDSLPEYRTLIDTDPAEVAALHQDFLIRVTEFFRDPDAFDALRQHVFPVVSKRESTKQPIRIWVPGCATGEEVYSLAIALVEFLGDAFAPDGVRIFGTDVSEAALEKARAGVYPLDALRNVSTDRLQRFFVSQGDEYRIAKEIRDLCIFARQDVTRDPPFSRLDLISCRNLLIYLDEIAQRRVLQVFHFALQPEGLVLFGPAETVGQSSELFEQADGRARLYRKRPATGTRSSASHPAADQPATGEVSAPAEPESLTREADRLLLARFAPANLIVDEELNIQQFRGRTGPFLEPVSGTPSFDLRRVVRPELLVELLPAIREAGESGRSSRRQGLHFDDVGEVNIEVVPMKGSHATWYLILLDDGSAPSREGRERPPASPRSESEKDLRLAQLQREVDAMRDYLRDTIEEHGAVTEELKSMHEEMLSANEEFQSTNEELETSKEELQSTNEELTTTIEELRNRNRDLAVLNTELERVRVASERARAYADVIIETVRAPLAVLDGELRIQRGNESLVAHMGIGREELEGRLLEEVQGGVWDIPELLQKLRAVFADGQSIDNYEFTQELPLRGHRVVSLSAAKIPGDEERSDLLLLAIDDITDRATITADLLADNRRKDEFLATLAHELRHPLTPIAHAIHLLRLNSSDAATASLYETIDTQTQRLLRFVNELLDVARISRSIVQIRREPVDFVTIARQAIETIQPLVEAHRHRLTVRLPSGPLNVSGDSIRLNQVITNLLENATRFTPSGGEIALTLERRGDEAVLSVRDSGIGIAPENLEPIFDLFAQADSARAHGGAGLGVGLSIARGVLELHGGRIRAFSNGLGTGSEFIASIPLLPANEPSASKPIPSADTRPVGAAHHPRRVLVVDDNEDISKSVMRLAHVWGHQVAVARDGPSALSLAQSFQPECAIVDIGLPGMNGYELARRLRESFPPHRLRLIALTGYGGANIREASLAAGFDEWLVKPGDVGQLEELLARDLPSPATTQSRMARESSVENSPR